MAIEIERKFLVTSDAYKKAAYNSYDMVQGYIAHENGNSVRVRITDSEAVMTIKGPSDSNGISRYEWNHLIPVEDAKELLKLSQGNTIEKRRYLVHSGPHVFEIDEFFGENEGLVIAEVELQSENEPFEKPSFVGKEVSGDRRYYNAYLTTNPYKSWSE